MGRRDGLKIKVISFFYFNWNLAISACNMTFKNIGSVFVRKIYRVWHSYRPLCPRVNVYGNPQLLWSTCCYRYLERTSLLFPTQLWRLSAANLPALKNTHTYDSCVQNSEPLFIIVCHLPVSRRILIGRRSFLGTCKPQIYLRFLSNPQFLWLAAPIPLN